MNWLLMKVMAVETNILGDDMDIEKLLKLVANIMLYGLGAAAVIGVIVAGIMYLTAKDNEQQVAKAKKRLLAWMVLSVRSTTWVPSSKASSGSLKPMWPLWPMPRSWRSMPPSPWMT